MSNNCCTHSVLYLTKVKLNTMIVINDYKFWLQWLSPHVNLQFHGWDQTKRKPRGSSVGAWCQTETLAVLELHQDLSAARPAKWCFGKKKKKHIATATTDSHICVASEEKVKHIVFLQMPNAKVGNKVGTQINHAITALQFSHYPYLLWHSQKETKHHANTYSTRELFQFGSKAESSKPPHHGVGSAGRAVCLKTLTECNSWTNDRTKKGKMDTQWGQL